MSHFADACAWWKKIVWDPRVDIHISFSLVFTFSAASRVPAIVLSLHGSLKAGIRKNSKDSFEILGFLRILRNPKNSKES